MQYNKCATWIDVNPVPHSVYSFSKMHFRYAFSCRMYQVMNNGFVLIIIYYIIYYILHYTLYIVYIIYIILCNVYNGINYASYLKFSQPFHIGTFTHSNTPFAHTTRLHTSIDTPLSVVLPTPAYVLYFSFFY